MLLVNITPLRVTGAGNQIIDDEAGEHDMSEEAKFEDEAVE